MKIRALVPINYNHKMREPGTVFECADEDVQPLLDVKAAEVAVKETKDTKAEKA